MDASLVVKISGWDIYLVLIDQEVAEWIHEDSKFTEETDKYGHRKVLCPESVKRKIWEAEYKENEGNHLGPFEEYEIYIDPEREFGHKLDVASWSIVINGEDGIFFGFKNLLEFINKHDINIVYECQTRIS